VSFPPHIALATKNPGKIKEILSICRDWPLEWIVNSPDDGRTFPDVEETGQTYEENAHLKAVETARALSLPAIADDSGIEVDALGGAPGPRSARFAGEDATDAENLQLLIARVRDVPEEDRTARYVCMAVCAWPDGRTVQASGVCEGRLILEPRGTGGFGYDPVFVPQGETRTMAELDPDEKDLISHRGRAFRALGVVLAT
jgi:XTP/dITP diphosphohydrolase